MNINLVNDNVNLLFINTEQEFFNGLFTLGQFSLFLIIIIIGIILTIIIPRQISKYISNYFFDLNRVTSMKFIKVKSYKKIEQDHRKKLQDQINLNLIQPLRNFIRIIIFSTFGLLAIYSLGFTFDTPFEIDGYVLRIKYFMIFLLIILIFVLFIKTTLPPVLRIFLHISVGRSVKRSDFNSLHRSLLRAFTYLFYYLMFISALYLGFPNISDVSFIDYLNYILIIFAIIIGTYFVTILFLTIFHIKYTVPKKMDRHASIAFENLVKVLAFIVLAGMLLSFIGFNPESIAFAIGIIGFAIAFGMQNTIANIMAGFSLAADRPFVIGDRIRVGTPGRETWGDVIDIGLNTTKIRTVEEETVVLPNNYIANNEIWNLTKDSPVIALTFTVGISYGSNWRLAEKIIIEEIHKHPYVLRKPRPFVRIDDFADFSINLKVWIWIKNAVDKHQIKSDILAVTKDRFDAEGIEIPFPYRTIVHKTDLAKEKPFPAGEKFDHIRRYPSKGRDYYEIGEDHLKDIPTAKVVHEEDTKILTPISDIHNAKQLAEYSMSMAKKIGGNVTAIFIAEKETRQKEMFGFKALSIFENYGTKYNVNVSTRVVFGDAVKTILETIEKDSIDLVVIGGRAKKLFGKWSQESIANEIIKRSKVPVVTMPYDLKWA